MQSRYGLKLGTGGAASDWTTGIANFERMRGDRLRKAQQSLRDNGLAAAVLFRPENVRYVTSVKGVEFIERIRYCILFAEHDPILYEPVGFTISEAPWISPDRVRLSLHWASQACGKVASIDTAKEFAEGIKDALREYGLQNERLGIDEIDEVGRAALVDAGFDLVNAMPVMLEARAVKTQDEINCFHMVASICDAAHWAMYEALKPGVRERDIRAVGFDALFRLGAEDVWDVLVSSGGNIGNRLSMNSDKLIQPGDMVTIDIVRATYMGYTSCYYRNYMVAVQPSQIQIDLHKASYDRMYSVIDSIKPGITTAELAEKWATAAEKGLKCDRNMWCDDLAHGLGLWLYEYPICNRLWSKKYPQVIEKGMTMAVEAMEFDPRVGRTKLEEMLVVTETGIEVFSRIPPDIVPVASPIVGAKI
jgi:Xaa-Pro dipeptidase